MTISAGGVSWGSSVRVDKSRLTAAAMGGRNRLAMELRSLHYFVRIAELGSITRAAAHLQIAQPALTRHIQRLEDELDASLFTRANRGVRLTEAGQKLFDSAHRILRDVERAGDEIRAHKAHPSGKIILGVTPPLCPVVVPGLFARMPEKYPLVELKVMHAGTARLEEFIVAGLVDLALMTMISRSRLIALTRLAEEEMVLVTRPGSRPSGIVVAEELSRTPLILGDGMRASLDVLLAGRGIALRVDTELDDHETIRLMVQQGVGASILPYSSVEHECTRGVIQAHRITATGVFRILATGVAASRGPSAARDAVAEVVSEVLGDIDAAGKLRLPPTPAVAGAVAGNRRRAKIDA
jgi:LysR family transcriptional regulator, nitrogen assimilation regulatory protein